MDFLKELSETPGVPGREERVRDLIIERTQGMFDEHRIDPMGNLICHKKAGRASRSKKPPKSVMLACHIDEIGFYVKFIDKEGRLRLNPAGGFDTRNLFARRVLVQGKRDLLGVLNPTGRPKSKTLPFLPFKNSTASSTHLFLNLFHSFTIASQTFSCSINPQHI